MSPSCEGTSAVSLISCVFTDIGTTLVSGRTMLIPGDSGDADTLPKKSFTPTLPAGTVRNGPATRNSMAATTTSTVSRTRDGRSTVFGSLGKSRSIRSPRWMCGATLFSGDAPPDVERFSCRVVRRSDARRPGAAVALRRPLPRRVDPHLAAKRRQLRRVVQIVDGTLCHLHVADGIDVRADDPGDLVQVVDVHVLVDDDNRLREHQLAEAPEGAHDLAGVSGVPLIDRDDDEIVKDAGSREMHVDDLRHRLP